jgi:exopolysaccharide production protein ExoZ
MPENKDTIASIQTLRAIAAMFVVTMHEQFYFSAYAKLVRAPLPAMSSWHNFLTFGGMGVDLFFIISGFIMAYLAARNPEQTLGEFFWRRVTRIVPLYWLITCFWLWKDPHHSAAYIFRSFFFIPVQDVFPLTGVGWTLNMEMFFYVIFGLIVIGLRRSVLWIAAIFLMLTIAGQFSNNYILKFYADPLIWCFFAGIVIHRLYRHPIVMRLAPVFLLLGVAGLVDACLNFMAPSALAVQTVIRWGCPCALLTLGCVSLEAGRTWNAFWRIRLVQALGAASYSIYLVHPIGFANINFYLLQYTSAVNILGPDGAVLLLICATALAGYLVHLFIELPSIEVLRAGRALAARAVG